MQEHGTVGGLSRDDDEDHDLLTFNEASIRLLEEIERTEGALTTAADGRERAAAELRLGRLREALARNTRRAESTPGETGFLDYRPLGAEENQ